MAVHIIVPCAHAARLHGLFMVGPARTCKLMDGQWGGATCTRAYVVMHMTLSKFFTAFARSVNDVDIWLT